ncbi:universal stress protein [Asaia bogorensis]|uniref:universal stress protein n=1 Tax=Asaia bogorensis TaxID=91915 RepID=UPI000EFCD792|nr:universal stress protein [Asaia bogorensis]
MANDVRNILVPLNGAGNIDAVLRVGLLHARAFNAHLSTVLVGDDPNEMAALTGEGLSSAMINEMMEAAEHEAHRRMLQVRLKFDAFIRDNDIEPKQGFLENDPLAHSRLSASLEFLTGSEHEAVTWRARLSDLTLMPHLGPNDNARASEVLHAVLYDSGCPLVIAPPTPPVSSGKRLCIAWNGTAEAASALRGALPYAKQAEAVQILTSVDYHRRGPEADTVQDYLKLHGVNAEIRNFKGIERDVGAGILAACADFGADMLTMGAYSHSRLRQMIMGGATRHVLEHAGITVLMSR